MKLKNIVKKFTAVFLCAGLLTACANTANNSENTSDATQSEETTSVISEETSEESTSAASEEKQEETTSESSEENTEGTGSAIENVKVTALSGPTAMGMTKLMSDNESESYGYDFNIVSAVDEVSALVGKGETDIFCVPANLSSVLYNKTEGQVQVLAVNTLGVIYICENGDTVKKVSDLKGKTIYASGKGATPEYALNYILTGNGIDPENDLTIEWKSEHAECLAALLADENGVAMLPQPFVTSAKIQNESVNVVLDLTEEWDKLEGDSSMITGVVAVRKEFAEKNPAVIDEFLNRYADSVNYVNENVADAAALVEKYGIVKAAVAEKAIPECNIVCITSGEMKNALSGYLKVLFEQNPQSVGGAEPEDDFYYGA